MLVLNSSHIWWRSHFEPNQILKSAFIWLLEHIFLRQFLKPLLTNQWDVSFCFPLNFLLAYIVDELWTSKNLFFWLYPQVQTFVEKYNLSKTINFMNLIIVSFWWLSMLVTDVVSKIKSPIPTCHQHLCIPIWFINHVNTYVLCCFVKCIVYSALKILYT